MHLTFVHTQVFVDDCRRLRMDDDDVQALEQLIMERPQGGAVMQGTGGLRKIRFAPPSWHTGKSGATRVCYIIFVEAETCYLVTVFAKNEKPNLSRAERTAVRQWVDATRRLHS